MLSLKNNSHSQYYSGGGVCFTLITCLPIPLCSKVLTVLSVLFYLCFVTTANTALISQLL